MDKIYKIDSLFSDVELSEINQGLNNMSSNNLKENYDLGRLEINKFFVSEAINKKLMDLINNLFGLNLTIVTPPHVVKYSNEYGNPNLPTHLDGDFNDVIIDYQLFSNTKWRLGVNKSVYSLDDNSALIFNPNKNIHWRPEKTFLDGEYVYMMFFRFYDPIAKSDYSYLPNHPNHEMFQDVSSFRDTIKD